MLIVVYLLAVVLVLFVAAVVATHDSAGLAEAPADRADVGLPDGVLQPEDLAEVRFGMVLRGYRMAEVDDTLARVGAELAARDARIRDLEQALVEVVEPQVEAAEARWTPPNTRSAPVVTSPSLVTYDKVVVPEPQVVAVPSRMPPVVRPWESAPEPSHEELPAGELPAHEPPTLEELPVEEAPPASDEISAADPEAVPEAEVELAPRPADPPAETDPYDDLFPEVLAPEPAAEGAVEATDVADPDETPSGEARPQA